VGFAALTMNQDLGLTQTAFGFGAGIFFIACFIFEVPSNLLLERFGARKWIARIMLSWGILSGTMAFIPAIARATGLGNETLSTFSGCWLARPRPASFPASSFI
jgi:MFS transporter, ACS family, tartrate transporter